MVFRADLAERSRGETNDFLSRSVRDLIVLVGELREKGLIFGLPRTVMSAARAEGRIGGRRPKFSQDEWAQMGRLIEGGMGRKQVAIIFDVGISTLYKKFPAGITN